MMNKLSLAGILLISIIIVVSVSFYKQRQQEMERVRSLMEEIQTISAKRLIIVKKINETKEKKQMFQTELDRCNEKIQQFQTDISETRQKQERLLGELSQKEGFFSELEDRLNLVTQQESELNNQLAQTKSDYQDVVKKIESTRAEKVALEEKIKTQIPASKEVELKKIVVKLTPPLKGEILEVNKEYSFAIIDLGLKDNIKSGDIFGIYRQDQLIAKAVAENIYEDMSSIIVLDEWQDVPILDSDTVKLLKP